MLYSVAHYIFTRFFTCLGAHFRIMLELAVFGKNGRLIIQHYRGRKGQRHPIFQEPHQPQVSPVARSSGVQAKIAREKLDFHQKTRVTRAKPKRTFPSDKSIVTDENQQQKESPKSSEVIKDSATMMQNGKNKPSRGTPSRPTKTALVAPTSPRPPPSRPRSSSKVRPHLSLPRCFQVLPEFSQAIPLLSVSAVDDFLLLASPLRPHVRSHWNSIVG